MSSLALSKGAAEAAAVRAAARAAAARAAAEARGNEQPTGKRRGPQCGECDGHYRPLNAWRGEERIYACDECGREMY